jgi:hypothetical protein
MVTDVVYVASNLLGDIVSVKPRANANRKDGIGGKGQSGASAITIA